MDRTQKNAVCILVLALTVYGSSHGLERALHSEYVCPCEVPGRIGTWEGTDIDAGSKDLISAMGAQQIVFRVYRSGGDMVALCLACYKDALSADKVHAPGDCYTAQGWTVAEDDIVPRSMGREKIMVNRLVVEKPGKRELVYTWWQTGGAVVPRNSVNRLYLVVHGIAGSPRSTVWVRLSMVSHGSVAEEEERLIVFMNELIPLLVRGSTCRRP